MPIVAMLACATAIVSPGLVAAQNGIVHPEAWPRIAWPVRTDAAAERRIADLLARMTVEEKVGQVIQADIASVTPEDVKRYHLGSVLNGGNSGPYGDDLAPAPKWLELADAFYAASTDRSGGGVGIPLIWGTDAVHGHSNIVGATLFPHNVGLGAANDPDLIQRIGAATAAEIRVTGQEWTFAPTITVPQDARWGRTYEGYSSDPALVARYADRMVLGLQGPVNGKPMLKGPYVLASTKHFLADGGTFEGRDQGDAKITEAQLRDIHGAPYGPVIRAGVGTVMTSFSSWQGVKMAGNKGLVTDVLKGRMGFGGFVVTDWNAHGQVAGCTNASCPQALLAGVDMYMAPDSWKPLYNSLLAQAKSGVVPAARLDDAVARILRVKMRLGLFEAGRPSSRPLSGQYKLLGAPEHRAIAREAVGKSLVLLKNQGVLPLKPGASILVAGDGADDIARQSGGWTLTWQGTGLTNANFPGATSIWGGIDAAVKKAGGKAQLAPDGKFTTRPDAAIVVFGETPYAEFQGDLKTLQLRSDQVGPLATMKRLKAQGIPVVAVMLTGRPLFTGEELNTADAFVVAWLPGSEGGGVADRLFSSSAGFTGRLSMPWPMSAKADGPVLYPLGYGMTGRERAGAWTPVSEDSGVAAVDDGGVFFADGVPSAAWSLHVSDGAADQTRVTSVPLAALGGRVTVRAVDARVQEGGREFALRGGGVTEVSLSPAGSRDLTREANGDVMTVATIRFDTAPAADARIVADCGGGCKGGAALPKTLPVGKWLTVGVPLKCFGTMTDVTRPFVIRTTGRMTFSLARVALGTSADRVLPCS
ncbi:glycoside hydrolase family 3 C-terminal domain-containing protein [Microvirga sp. SRT01]|uniref:Glycoside hydrolase family 3 C-terminal domain-containing protein n=1 Tax=Sphingomonas longa TaxID=2778730 RepID=A0ABS2DAM5_9SPHN|nr:MULTISPECIES: glycoside hydrolase family 3 protein [Alphaproteobacteria]MBM6577980.1 glycoside hydrolase family 3 C-terminal domain-containing protein [Sphingomonas sp. BT552]MBR7711021.1 glycoside hydrolase family 3 C-terminal domain-containing protein [Microvirga sp. SRT01]